MNDNNQIDLLLESGITDFVALNSLYKRLVIIADIKKKNNCQLLSAIKMNFKVLMTFALIMIKKLIKQFI